MLLIICVERLATSHSQPLFSKKMAAAASFSYKIGGGGLIFQQNWRRQQGFGNITGSCSDMVWILVNLLTGFFLMYKHECYTYMNSTYEYSPSLSMVISNIYIYMETCTFKLIKYHRKWNFIINWCLCCCGKLYIEAYLSNKYLI